MTSPLPSFDSLSDQPVFGATQFIGRSRLAQNLLSRCRRGESILLYGGPKLGKTSLLLHLKWLAEQNGDTSSGVPAAVYVDAAEERTRDQFLRGQYTQCASILLVDNCDHLLQKEDVSTLHEWMQRPTLAHAIIWVGTPAWHDVVLKEIGPTAFRRVPLAVLFEGEARELLKPYLAEDQRQAALGSGGTHPYVLKVIAQELRSGSDGSTRAVQTAADRLIPFFQACREALRQKPEQALYRYLAQEARAIAPQEAARALGLSAVKSAADALCSLGVISRWNLRDGAMLQANCRLFNDWYLATVPWP
jgi:hypothetical protein